MKLKVLLINLEKDKDRLDFMTKQLNDLGIDFERLSAVYGKDYIGGEYDEEVSKKENGKSLTAGEVGCALSHKRAHQNFLNSDSDYCLVLEDDVYISKDFKDILYKEIYKNEDYKEKKGKYLWEYLQFDYWTPSVFWKKIWWDQIVYTHRLRKGSFLRLLFVLKTIFKIPFVLMFAIFEIVREKLIVGPVKFYRDIYLAGAYLMNKDGVNKIFSLENEIIYPADKIQNEAKKLNDLKIRYYSPVICRQKREVFGSSLLNMSGKEFAFYSKLKNK